MSEYDMDMPGVVIAHCPIHGNYVYAGAYIPKTSAWPVGLCKECHVGKKYAVYESEMDFIREVMTTRGV